MDANRLTHIRVLEIKFEIFGGFFAAACYNGYKFCFVLNVRRDAAAAKADAVFRQIPRRDALKQRRHRADELLRTVIGGLPFSGIYPLLGGAGGVREF